MNTKQGMPAVLDEGMTNTLALDGLLAYLHEHAGAAFRTIDEYGGEFNGAEVPRLSFNCPAVFVTCLGWQPPTGPARIGGKFASRSRFAAFIVTQDYRGRNTRMRMACDRAELVSALVADWRPPGCAGPAQDIRAQNLYGSAVDQKSMALWSVTWWHDTAWRDPREWIQQLPELDAVDIHSIGHTHVDDTPPAPNPLSVDHQITMDPETGESPRS